MSREFKPGELVKVSDEHPVRKGKIGKCHIKLKGERNQPKKILVKMEDGESFWIPANFLIHIDHEEV